MNCIRQLLVALGLGLTALGVPVSAQADDVIWLPKVQKIPPDVPREGIGELTPLLLDESGRAISTREGWEKQRQIVRKQWLSFLGAMPEPRPAVKLELIQ